MSQTSTRATYTFRWGNTPKRAAMKGRRLVVLARGAMNSALVRFIDNDQLEVISRNALRRVGGP